MFIDPRLHLPPAPCVGDVVLGCFRLGQQVGAGAFAAAYLAEQLGTDRLAVVKIPHPHLLHGPQGPELRRRFDAEVKAATRAKHPNLVTVYIVGETQYGVPAIAMEHVAGESLFDRLSRSAPLPTTELVAVGAQLAEAIGALHEVGIVHRDLSPANVLVRVRRGPDELVRVRRGPDELVRVRRGPDLQEPAAAIEIKLLDFGVAKLLDAPSRTLGPMGTPGYLAPEQLVGDVTTRCDVYSLGAVLWWASTGRERPDDFSDGSLRAALGRRVGPDPRAVNPTLPAAVAELIARALIPEPLLRPSASEFSTAWRAAWNGPRVHAPIVPAARRSTPTSTPFRSSNERVTTARGQLSARVAMIVSNPVVSAQVCCHLIERGAQLGGVVVSQPSPRELGRASPGAFDLAILGEVLGVRRPQPEIDTATLVTHLRGCYPELRIVIVGFDGERSTQWLDSGADAFVRIPDQLDSLDPWLDPWLDPGLDPGLGLHVDTLGPSTRSSTVNPEPRLRRSLIERMLVVAPDDLAARLESLIGCVPDWIAQIDGQIDHAGSTRAHPLVDHLVGHLVQGAESVGASDLARLARAVAESLASGDPRSARVFLAAAEREYLDVFQEAFRLLSQINREDPSP